MGVKMDKKFNSLLSVCIIPQTISLIAEKEDIDDIQAMNEFYNSQVYDLLSREETKMWHYSPMMLYTLWKHESETGEIIFPEGI